jgi:phosphoglycerol transferase MdoB-like AlkP superfamily enzyme
MNKLKLDELLHKVDPKYLNPLQCNLSFMHCNAFVYFVIGMVVLFTVWLLFFSSKYSKFSLLLTTVCLGLIFIGCSLLLLNMCALNKPDLYNYIALGCSAIVVLLVLRFFRSSDETPKQIIQQVPVIVPQQPVTPTN